MLVVEKHLGVLGGHFPTQVSAIQNLVGKRPLTFITGRECELSFDGTPTILPVLSTQKDILAKPEQAADHDFHSMRDILASKMLLQAESIIYITAQPHDFRVALRLVCTIRLLRKIYMRVLHDKEVIQLTDDERRALKCAVDAGQIVLLTETKSMAAHLLARYDLAFHKKPLCLPCSLFPGQATSLSSSAHSAAGHYRVGCLGGWRTEKGIKMLPQIIRHVRDTLNVVDGAPKVEFIIQKPSREKTLKSIRKRVKHNYPFWRSVGLPMPRKRLSLSFRATDLSKEEFLTTLMSVDLLLVPYCLDDYRHRGSGIILDGVAARKPIVYTKGMGMTEFLTHGNAEAALEDPKDYADKVVRILSDIKTYNSGADQALVEFESRIEQTAFLLRSI